jgi:hypothetical protein
VKSIRANFEMLGKARNIRRLHGPTCKILADLIQIVSFSCVHVQCQTRCWQKNKNGPLDKAGHGRAFFFALESHLCLNATMARNLSIASATAQQYAWFNGTAGTDEDIMLGSSKQKGQECTIELEANKKTNNPSVSVRLSAHNACLW